MEAPLTLRIDTPIEVDYFLHGGILPYVLRQLIAEAPTQATTSGNPDLQEPETSKTAAGGI